MALVYGESWVVEKVSSQLRHSGDQHLWDGKSQRLYYGYGFAVIVLTDVTKYQIYLRFLLAKGYFFMGRLFMWLVIVMKIIIIEMDRSALDEVSLRCVVLVLVLLIGW